MMSARTVLFLLATSCGLVHVGREVGNRSLSTGASNDRDRILVNIGGTVPTNVMVEQLR
jgi:hypothetical protein